MNESRVDEGERERASEVKESATTSQAAVKNIIRSCM